MLQVDTRTMHDADLNNIPSSTPYISRWRLDPKETHGASPLIELNVR